MFHQIRKLRAQIPIKLHENYDLDVGSLMHVIFVRIFVDLDDWLPGEMTIKMNILNRRKCFFSDVSNA